MHRRRTAWRNIATQNPWLFKMRPVKILVRLREWAHMSKDTFFLMLWLYYCLLCRIRTFVHYLLEIILLWNKEHKHKLLRRYQTQTRTWAKSDEMICEILNIQRNNLASLGCISFTGNMFHQSVLIMWAASSEKMPSSMRKMYGVTSSCTRAKYHPGFCSLSIHFAVPNDSISG